MRLMPSAKTTETVPLPLPAKSGHEKPAIAEPTLEKSRYNSIQVTTEESHNLDTGS